LQCFFVVENFTFQEKELSIEDWKWAVYQTITRLTFHQGNKHTYAYKWSSLLEPINTSIPHIRNLFSPWIQFCINCEPKVLQTLKWLTHCVNWSSSKILIEEQIMESSFMDLYSTSFYWERLRRMVPLHSNMCSKFAVPSWKNYFKNENELSIICSSIRILLEDQLTQCVNHFKVWRTFGSQLMQKLPCSPKIRVI
jgi:hypothetical protein